MGIYFENIPTAAEVAFYYSFFFLNKLLPII